MANEQPVPNSNDENPQAEVIQKNKQNTSEETQPITLQPKPKPDRQKSLPELKKNPAGDTRGKGKEVVITTRGFKLTGCNFVLILTAIVFISFAGFIGYNIYNDPFGSIAGYIEDLVSRAGFDFRFGEEKHTLELPETGAEVVPTPPGIVDLEPGLRDLILSFLSKDYEVKSSGVLNYIGEASEDINGESTTAFTLNLDNVLGYFKKGELVMMITNSGKSDEQKFVKAKSGSIYKVDDKNKKFYKVFDSSEPESFPFDNIFFRHPVNMIYVGLSIGSVSTEKNEEDIYQAQLTILTEEEEVLVPALFTLDAKSNIDTVTMFSDSEENKVLFGFSYQEVEDINSLIAVPKDYEEGE